jgi:hypothetical protein
MELKDFAIWNEIPNYSIATGNSLPKGSAKIGVSLSLIVTDIQPDATLHEVIDKLRKSKYADLFTQREVRGEFNSSGFREAWPREVKNEEVPFRMESPNRIVTWDGLE